jgi:hypothetical protein
VTRDTVLASTLEEAAGLWGRFMGLMGRATLEPGGGLWLPGSNGIHMMFMRFPIDAVFLGPALPAETGAGVHLVLSTHERLRTWVGLVPLVRGAYGVLELPVGTISGSATAAGDRIVLERSPG